MSQSISKKEIIRFKKNFCNFGISLSILGWVVGVLTDYGSEIIAGYNTRSTALTISGEVEFPKKLLHFFHTNNRLFLYS
jgi:hypothetical protein